MSSNRYHSESPFYILLALELLRAQLKDMYGPDIKFFSCVIDSREPRQVRTGQETITSAEFNGFRTGTIERYISISATIGPFERRFISSNRKYQRQIEALCRVFSIDSRCIFWRPHFLMIRVDENGEGLETNTLIYERGSFYGTHQRDIDENPCEAMCANQVTANYRLLHPKLDGQLVTSQ